MDRLKRVPKEPLIGMGEIRRDGEHFVNCNYQIQVTQEYSVTESYSVREDIPGYEIYTGQVTLKKEDFIKPEIREAMTSGDTFTLIMANGKSLKVSFSRLDLIGRNYKIIHLPQR